MRGELAAWFHSHDSRFRVARRSSATVWGARLRIWRRVTIATRVRGRAAQFDPGKSRPPAATARSLLSRAEDQRGGVQVIVLVESYVVELRAPVRANRRARIAAGRHTPVHAEKPFNFACDLVSGVAALLAIDDGRRSEIVVGRTELKNAGIERHFDRNPLEHASERALTDVVPRAQAAFGRAMGSDLRARRLNAAAAASHEAGNAAWFFRGGRRQTLLAACPRRRVAIPPGREATALASRKRENGGRQTGGGKRDALHAPDVTCLVLNCADVG